MILTVCLSPNIDVNIEVDALNVGMTHKIINKRVFFTGNALNVAVGISRLKSQAFATGFMYEDNGSQFENQLHRDGVPYKFIWNKGRVCENYKFVDRRSMMTEVTDTNPDVDEDKQEELLELIANLSENCEAIVISGGLAGGMKPDFYKRILERVPNRLLKIVDTDGENLKEILKCGVDLVKPNLSELETALNKQFRTHSEMLSGCMKLLDMGAKRVLLSLGKKGAIITDGNKSFYCKSINVAMNSTVGAGDGMVAGATCALSQGLPIEEILRCGVAAGSAAVTSPNSISFGYEKYKEILSNITVKEL